MKNVILWLLIQQTIQSFYLQTKPLKLHNLLLIKHGIIKVTIQFFGLIMFLILIMALLIAQDFILRTFPSDKYQLILKAFNGTILLLST